MTLYTVRVTCVGACIHVRDCPLHARDMTCSEKEKENSNHLCCLRNRARKSSIVNSGGLCGHRFRRILSTIEEKQPPGPKDYVVITRLMLQQIM